MGGTTCLIPQDNCTQCKGPPSVLSQGLTRGCFVSSKRTQDRTHDLPKEGLLSNPPSAHWTCPVLPVDVTRGSRVAAGREELSQLNGDVLAQLMWSYATVAEARVAARGPKAAQAPERRGAPVHTSALDYSGTRVPELLQRCWPEVPVTGIMHALMHVVAAQRPSMQVRPPTRRPAAAPSPAHSVCCVCCAQQPHARHSQGMRCGCSCCHEVPRTAALPAAESACSYVVDTGTVTEMQSAACRRRQWPPREAPEPGRVPVRHV